ncbi:regucalcin-like [Cylas formicarius]|uniref:regucalcin-like n=1 Tax=Cylas formicarius TaxID=197179 RepID=UPI00295870F3|nr:regucalcin-like [Cylas formicarius]
MAPKVERIPEIPNVELGEGPHWDEKSQSLYFVDILGNTIHKYHPATKKHTQANIGAPVSIIIPVQGEKDRFLISIGREIALVTWDGISDQISNIQKIAEGDPGTNNRFNDGKCDPSGRLWVGTMGPEPENGHVQPERGSLYSVKGNEIKKHFSNIGISNGLAWNLSLKKMYYIDSFKGTVDQFDFDIETGSIANRTSIFTLDKHGLASGTNLKTNVAPDGMTIDTDGNLWVAVFNSNSVLKIDPRTPETLLETVKIPAK